MKSQFIWMAALVGVACGPTAQEQESTAMKNRLAKYTTVKLEADLSGLSDNQREMIPLLKQAAEVMDELFWLQAYGDKLTLLATTEDPDAKQFVQWNYGPWDRLEANAPFLPEAGPKPKGANFYPTDMTVEEFEQAVAASDDEGAQLKSLYTVVQRDAEGKLVARPYHEAYGMWCESRQDSFWRRRSSPKMTDSESTSSYGRKPSPLTTIEQATSPGWT